MYDDDEVLDAYEEELGRAAPGGVPAMARRPHGFWLVVGAMTLGCIVLLGEIFANRSIGNDIGTSEHDLRVARTAALRIDSQSDSFAAADAAGLLGTGGLTFVGPRTPSSGQGNVSVYASDNVWAAAVQARPGACFYIRVAAGTTGTRYGAGTTCTGVAALSSNGGQW